ncbi:glycosyltransferase family 4 protein [Gemmatimonas aurantiaca]|nr:glycosyltransferase family 4 protein [Gemmatimonas aurantiaca]
MNILALNWQDLKNPLSGGAEVHLEELLRRLVAMGHTVTLFCSNFEGGTEEDTVQGVRIIRRGGRYDFNFIAPFHLRKLIKREKFDILIEDINKIPFYTPLYLNIPTLVVIPHLFSTSVFQEINFVLGSYIYLFEKPMASIYRGRKFNVISESTADDLRARAIPQADISVVHCGIDSEMYNVAENVEKDPFPSVIYLGRIKKYKSVQHLIQAISQLKESMPEIKLTIVGAGDYMDELKSLTTKLNLDDTVEFTGFISPEEKVNRLRRAHVCVCPSFKEGWGLTNIEANACGTVTVSADVEGLRDSLRDGETGFLYPYGDINALANGLAKILSDVTLRKKLEAGALKWAANFSWDSAAERFMEVVEDTIASEISRSSQTENVQ